MPAARAASIPAALSSMTRQRKAKGADFNRAGRGAAYPDDIIPEWRAKSSWNAERDRSGRGSVTTTVQRSGRLATGKKNEPTDHQSKRQSDV
jgi:hypothetical protein